MFDLSDCDLVIDIADPCLLEDASLEDLCGAFEKDRGIAPNLVALPLTCHRGVPFNSENWGLPVVPLRWDGVESTLTDVMGNIASGSAAPIEGAFLTVKPDMQCVHGSHLHVLDIADKPSAQMCFGKKSVVELFADLTAEALDKIGEEGRAALRGIALDLVDLWPMGGEGSEIYTTCFCPTCSDDLQVQGVELELFRRHPNPFLLALRPSATGIRFLADISPDAGLDELLRKAATRGWDLIEDRDGKPISENVVRQWAEALLRYMAARNDLTLSRVTDFFEMLGERLDGLRRAVVIESDRYDWTAGVFMEAVDEEAAVTEVWLDPSENQLVPSKKPFMYYLWERSRYFIDALFDTMSAARSEGMRVGTGLGRKRPEAVLELRYHMAMASKMEGRAVVATLPEDDACQGVAEAAIYPDLSDRFETGAPPRDALKTFLDLFEATKRLDEEDEREAL